jgi:hypothetical protein
VNLSSSSSKNIKYLPSFLKLAAGGIENDPNIEYCWRVEYPDSFLKGPSALSNSPDQRAAGWPKTNIEYLICPAF